MNGVYKLGLTRSAIFSLLDNFTDRNWSKRRETCDTLAREVGGDVDSARETAYAISDKFELCRETKEEAEFKNILYWSTKTLGMLSFSEECCVILTNIVKDRFLKDKYREIAMSELMKFPYIEKFRDELVGLLCDPDWKIRQLAARHLETFPAEGVSRHLITEFHSFTNDDVIYWVLQIIAHQLNDDAIAFFETTLYSSPTNTKLYVLLALAEIRSERAFKIIVDCFDDPSYMIRTQVHQIIDKNVAACAKFVHSFAYSTDFRTRCEALKFLIKSMDPEYQSMITRMVTQGSTETKILGLISLGDVGEKIAADFIYDRFSDDSWYIRNFAATIMSKYGHLVWGYLLGKYRSERNANNRYWILVCLKNIINASSESAISGLASIFANSRKTEKLQILGMVKYFAESSPEERFVHMAMDFLVDALGDIKWIVRKEAAKLLGAFDWKTVSARAATRPGLTADQKFWLETVEKGLNV